MKIEDLMKTLEANNLFPVRVEGIADKGDSHSMVMIGDLEYFIKSAKALDEKVVFITERIFEESDFTYEVNAFDDNDDDFTEEAEDSVREIDLSTLLPSVDKYKEHFGKECAFRLSVRFGNNVLEYYQPEKWWLEFSELRIQAIEKIEADEDAIRSKIEEERREQQKVLTNKIKELINDDKFVRLAASKSATQRGMMTYALEAIPNLDDLSPDVIKLEIQLLHDRIKAKKLLEN